MSYSTVLLGGCGTPIAIDEAISHPEPEVELALEWGEENGPVTNPVQVGSWGGLNAAQTDGWLPGSDGRVPDSTPACQYVETELVYRGELYRRAYMTLANSDGLEVGTQADIGVSMWSPSINGIAVPDGVSRFRVAIAKVPPAGFKPSTLRCCHIRTDIGIENLMFHWNGCLWELQSGSD